VKGGLRFIAGAFNSFAVNPLENKFIHRLVPG